VLEIIGNRFDVYTFDSLRHVSESPIAIGDLRTKTLPKPENANVKVVIVYPKKGTDPKGIITGNYRWHGEMYPDLLGINDFQCRESKQVRFMHPKSIRYVIPQEGISFLNFCVISSDRLGCEGSLVVSELAVVDPTNELAMEIPQTTESVRAIVLFWRSVAFPKGQEPKRPAMIEGFGLLNTRK